MTLCTVDMVKNRLTITSADHDDLLAQIVAGVSGALALAAGRSGPAGNTLEKSTRTDLLSVDGRGIRYLWLPSWPVVSMTSVKEAAMKAFDDVDALTENTDYTVDYAAGRLTRWGGWWPGDETVQVVYVAGYTTPTESEAGGYEQGATEVLMPGEIIEAAIEQATFVFQSRENIGLSGQSAGGASISTYARQELLPGVRKTMKAYRRWVC